MAAHVVLSWRGRGEAGEKSESKGEPGEGRVDGDDQVKR
jgi:hypothetical protein